MPSNAKPVTTCKMQCRFHFLWKLWLVRKLHLLGLGLEIYLWNYFTATMSISIFVSFWLLMVHGAVSFFDFWRSLVLRKSSTLWIYPSIANFFFYLFMSKRKYLWSIAQRKTLADRPNPHEHRPTTLSICHPQSLFTFLSETSKLRPLLAVRSKVGGRCDESIRTPVL